MNCVEHNTLHTVLSAKCVEHYTLHAVLSVKCVEHNKFPYFYDKIWICAEHKKKVYLQLISAGCVQVHKELTIINFISSGDNPP